MGKFFEATNQQRCQFAGFVLAGVALVMGFERVIILTTTDVFSQMDTFQSVSLADRIVQAAGGTEMFGLVLVAAAFLLMLDSDDEPNVMKVAIISTFVLSLGLFALSVTGMLFQLFEGDEPLSLSEGLQVVFAQVTPIALSFAAGVLTWDVVRSPQFSSSSNDVDGNPDQQSA
jgi:hypothetical protein